MKFSPRFWNVFDEMIFVTPRVFEVAASTEGAFWMPNVMMNGVLVRNGWLSKNARVLPEGFLAAISRLTCLLVCVRLGPVSLATPFQFSFQLGVSHAEFFVVGFQLGNPCQQFINLLLKLFHGTRSVPSLLN
jgi:hypothetical protein